MRIGFTIVATVALLAALPFGAAAEEMITKKGLPLPPRSSGTGDGTAQDSGAKLYHPDDKRAVLPPRSRRPPALGNVVTRKPCDFVTTAWPCKPPREIDLTGAPRIGPPQPGLLEGDGGLARNAPSAAGSPLAPLGGAGNVGGGRTGGSPNLR